jgi:hypothetical protein
MVFILGYVFGNFSQKKELTTLTKVASILVIVLFVFAGVAGRPNGHHRLHHHEHCDQAVKDSTNLH